MASGYRREPLEFYKGRDGRPRQSHGAPWNFGCFPGRELYRAVDAELRYRGGGHAGREGVSWRQNCFSGRGGDQRWRGRSSGGFWPPHDWRSRDELVSVHRRRPNYYPSCNLTVQKTSFKLSPRYEHGKWSQEEASQGSVSREESSGDDGTKRAPHPLSRRKSPIYPLRTFNNWAKVKMIQEAIPDNVEQSMAVMDLGCCKGVDLKKWAHSRVRHVYLVEEDKDDMEECQKRFIEINNRWPDRFKATFINKDFAFDTITLPELVDVVSCQFFVQRAFGAEEQALTLAKNVSDALKPGGHFICSLVNAEKIKKFFDRIDNKTRCSNGVFSVDLDSPLSDESTEFGVKMLFRVDDKFFPENLVRLGTLVRIMGQAGLELVWRRSFSQLYEEARNDDEQKKLLITMGVEEKGKLLMTRSQMETADLYEALMFRKMEPQEPEEGKNNAVESANTQKLAEENARDHFSCPEEDAERGSRGETEPATGCGPSPPGDLTRGGGCPGDLAQSGASPRQPGAAVGADTAAHHASAADIKLKDLIEVMDCDEIDGLLEKVA